MKYVKPMSLFHDLLMAKPKGGRLLGLDVGDKYVGLAISEPDNKVASPLGVLCRKQSNIDDMATDFSTLISELSLTGFVVGYPFDRQKASPTAVQVKLLIDDLKKTQKLEKMKYTFWDESFTSKNAELLIRPLDLPPVEAKTIIDKYAALGILQAYLDYFSRKYRQES